MIGIQFDLSPATEKYEHLEKTICELERVSGYSLYQLLKLFKAGYTLTLPKGASLNQIISVLLEE